MMTNNDVMTNEEKTGLELIAMILDTTVEELLSRPAPVPTHGRVVRRWHELYHDCTEYEDGYVEWFSIGD